MQTFAMAPSELLTFMCIGMVSAATASPTSSEDCPPISSIGCRNSTLPCQAPTPVTMQSTYNLRDGVVCEGCILCSSSEYSCPPVACALIKLPDGCTNPTWYHLTIQLEKQSCWACDYLRSCEGDT